MTKRMGFVRIKLSEGSFMSKTRLSNPTFSFFQDVSHGSPGLNVYWLLSIADVGHIGDIEHPEKQVFVRNVNP